LSEELVAEESTEDQERQLSDVEEFSDVPVEKVLSREELSLKEESQ